MVVSAPERNDLVARAGTLTGAVQQRLPSLLPRPILFAHRGARAHAPENTVEAFELALRLGATGLETEAWVTADGVVILDRDGSIRTGWFARRPIGEIPRHELPDHIPSLGEVLDACGASYHLFVGLGDGAAAGPVVDTIRTHAPDLLERTWLRHPDPDLLSGLRSLDAPVRLIDSTRLTRLREGPERRAARLAGLGIDGIYMPSTDWNGGLVTLFHRFGLVAFASELQHEHELVTAIRMGADAVSSDHVDRMSDAARTELG